MNPRHLAMATAAVVSATVILTLLWLLNVPSLPVTAGAVTTTSTRYVSTTGTDSDDCTDSTSPCRTVQYAVDQASEGGTIKVASGTYTDIHQRASITQVVYISKTVTVRGSYTIDSWTTSDPENNPTTLDAQGQGRVLYITAPEPGTGISPTIEGLHITGGDTAVVADSEWDGEPGGGVYAITATLTLSRCRVVSNTSNRFAPFGGSGGGVYLRNSRNAALIGNIIRDNGAESGGGIYLWDSDNATLVGNTIQGNRVVGWHDSGSGGGISLFNSPDATLIDNVIQGNIAQHGGGVYLWDSNNATLSDNTILSNTATGGHLSGMGGALLLWESDQATLSGNVIRGNFGGSGSVYLEESDDATLSDNVIQNNSGGAGAISLCDSDNGTLNNTVVVDNNQFGWAESGIYVMSSTVDLRHTTLARNAGSGLYVTDYPWGGTHSTVALTNTVLVSHTVGITVTAGNTVTLNGILWYENEANTGGLGTLTVTHQITGNPAFAADGYHITPPSAAVDTGVDAGVTADIDGEPRPAGKGYDIGADEVLAALRVMKQANPSPVEPGARLTYTIRATNTGHVDLHAVITDALPLSITLAETSGGTLLLPGGGIGITWTAIIPTPGGIWNGTLVVTVAEDCEGSLTNLVQVTTKEGATGVYIETSAISGHSVYLPIVLKSWPPMPPAPEQPARCHWKQSSTYQPRAEHRSNLPRTSSSRQPDSPIRRFALNPKCEYNLYRSAWFNPGVR